MVRSLPDRYLPTGKNVRLKYIKRIKSRIYNTNQKNGDTWHLYCFLQTIKKKKNPFQTNAAKKLKPLFTPSIPLSPCSPEPQGFGEHGPTFFNVHPL